MGGQAISRNSEYFLMRRGWKFLLLRIEVLSNESGWSVHSQKIFIISNLMKVGEQSFVMRNGGQSFLKKMGIRMDGQSFLMSTGGQPFLLRMDGQSIFKRFSLFSHQIGRSVHSNDETGWPVLLYIKRVASPF